MRLDFFLLLNAAAELGPILLFLEVIVGFDGKPNNEDTFGVTTPLSCTRCFSSLEDVIFQRTAAPFKNRPNASL
jgi:hypothetical protein